MAVRSNYIKSLMDSKKSLDAQFQEIITESMKNIIGDNAKDEMRKLLKESEEDEDSFQEEEVDVDAATTDGVEDATGEDDVTVVTDTEADGDAEEIDGDLSIDAEGEGETETDIADVDGMEDVSDETDDTDVWDDLENCKSADGEYDCRGMEHGNLIKVLKAMGPEEGVRVMRNDNGTVTVEVDGSAIDGTQEFIIDIDGMTGGDGETVEEGALHEANLGYTTDYQDETAMTVDNNDEPADKSKTRSWDAGVPKGTEKPWAKPNKKAGPYGKAVKNEVNECGEGPIIEVEIDEKDQEAVNEVMSSSESNPTVRGTGMTHANTNKKGKQFRNSSEGGVKVKGTGENSYSGVDEATKRKMNAIYEENKQLKALIPMFEQKINESIVINASMGYIVRILNENSTTSEEKQEITKRFGKATSLTECKNLYETISDELKKVNRTNGVTDLINSQLAEGKQTKQSLVETTMYKSEKVSNTLDFMKRLNAIK